MAALPRTAAATAGDRGFRDGPQAASRAAKNRRPECQTGRSDRDRLSMERRLSLLPLISLFHFWRLVCTAHVVTTGNPPKVVDSVWSWSGLTSLYDRARICTQYNVDPHISCEGNTTILPGLEPWALAILTGAAVLALDVTGGTYFVVSNRARKQGYGAGTPPRSR
jgi:hypothetical protein